LDVDIYPAAEERLALEIKFQADVPGRLFDVTGRLYVTARPDVADQKLRFEDVRFSRILDNALWDVGSAAFEGAIRRALEQAATIDLAPLLQQAAEAVAEAIGDAARVGGIAVILEDLHVTLETVVPEDNALAALVHIEGSAQGIMREPTMLR
jgi:hypothetical protein